MRIERLSWGSVRRVSVTSGVCSLDVIGRGGEGHVGLYPARPDASAAAGDGSPVPRVVGAIGGPDVEVVSGQDHPHRHVGPQAAIAATRGEIQLGRRTDAAQLVVAPGGAHSDPTRISDLMARRSSIAEYA